MKTIKELTENYEKAKAKNEREYIEEKKLIELGIGGTSFDTFISIEINTPEELGKILEKIPREGKYNINTANINVDLNYHISIENPGNNWQNKMILSYKIKDNRTCRVTIKDFSKVEPMLFNGERSVTSSEEGTYLSHGYTIKEIKALRIPRKQWKVSNQNFYGGSCVLMDDIECEKALKLLLD